MDLLVYTGIITIIIIIAFIQEYFVQKKKSYEKITEYSNILVREEIKLPLFNISILTLILSIYSANLGVSEKLSDTVKYAWSFLYRYPNYYGSFETLITARTEPGFLLLNMTVGKITNNPFWLFFIISIVTTFINLSCLTKLNKRYTFMVFIYLISLYFFQTTYLLRQTIAVSFGNLALLSYLTDNKIRYFTFSMIALMFHTTAILLLPLFFIYSRPKSKKIYYYIILIAFLVFILFGPILNNILPRIPYINQYINIENINLSNGGGSAVATLKGIPFYFITILALFRRDTLQKRLYKADFYILSSLIYSISWIFTYNMYWFFRVGWYFLLPTLVLVPNLFSTFKNARERILCYMIFICSMILVTYRQIYITLY